MGVQDMGISKEKFVIILKDVLVIRKLNLYVLCWYCFFLNIKIMVQRGVWTCHYSPKNGSADLRNNFFYWHSFLKNSYTRALGN